MPIRSRWPLTALAGGALLLGSERALTETRSPPRGAGGPDVYAGVVHGREGPTAQSGTLAGLGLGTGRGLPIRGNFEVPLWAALFTDGKFGGTTRLHASDGHRMLIVLRAKAKVLGVEHTRDVLLTLRPDGGEPAAGKPPTRFRFAGRMVKAVPDALLEEVKRDESVDAQIRRLLSSIEGEGEGGAPKSPEALLVLDGATANEVKLTRLRSNGARAEPVTFRRDGDQLRLSFKGYNLELELPR